MLMMKFWERERERERDVGIIWEFCVNDEILREREREREREMLE